MMELTDLRKFGHPPVANILLHSEQNGKNFYLVETQNWRGLKNKKFVEYFIMWGNTTDEAKMGCFKVVYDSGRKMDLKGALKRFFETLKASEFVEFKN